MALAVNVLLIAGIVFLGIASYLRSRAAVKPTKPSGALRTVRIAAMGVGCSIAALIMALMGTQPKAALVVACLTAAWVGIWVPKRFRRVRVESKMVFHCPPDEAFDFFADSRNEPRYQSMIERVEQLSPARIGVGTVFRAWVNVASDSEPGLRLVVEEEITEFFPPRFFATKIVGKMDRSRLTFNPIEGGTQVQASYEGLIEFDAALVGGVLRRHEAQRRILDARRTAWARAKAILESQAA
jgi:hypothetical protein